MPPAAARLSPGQGGISAALRLAVAVKSRQKGQTLLLRVKIIQLELGPFVDSLILARWHSNRAWLGVHICFHAGTSAARHDLAVGNVLAQLKAPDC